MWGEKVCVCVCACVCVCVCVCVCILLRVTPINLRRTERGRGREGGREGGRGGGGGERVVPSIFTNDVLTPPIASCPIRVTICLSMSRFFPYMCQCFNATYSGMSHTCHYMSVNVPFLSLYVTMF
jgi:hypothetical protein